MKNKHTVFIGALEYTISYESDLVHQGLDGKITHCEGSIRLRPNMNPAFERVILWHEIIHAILTNAAMDEQDERMIIVLAHGVAQVIGDNTFLGINP